MTQLSRIVEIFGRHDADTVVTPGGDYGRVLTRISVARWTVASSGA